MNFYKQKRQPSVLRVAFIAHTPPNKAFRQDASFIYRCESLGLALQAQGHQVSFLHWTAVRPHHVFDIVVFHRPRYSLLWQALFCWLKRKGCVLIADVDDLIFDSDLAIYSPGVLNGLVALEKTKQQFSNHYRALACFNKIMVSTATLAEQIKRCLPLAQVQVLPNAVHYTWQTLPVMPKLTTPLNITYFSGTRSHDRDFAIYAKAVERFLAENPKVQLHVTGPLRVNLSTRPEQFVHHEKVVFSDYAQRVQQAWVNLAPLETTAFTQCKSALKIIEAGFWGIPTVCTPFADALNFESTGAVFAVDEQSCFDALQALLKPDYYSSITKELSVRVLAKTSIEGNSMIFLQFANTKSINVS